MKAKLEALGVFVYKLPDLSSLTKKLFCIFLMNIFVLKERLKGSVFISHFLVTALIVYPTLVPFNHRLVIYTEGLGSFFSRRPFFQKILQFLLSRNSATRLFCNNSERQLVGLATDTVTGGIGIELNSYPRKSKLDEIKHYELLYIGRLIKDKGVHDAIAVLRLLREKNYNVRLSLVGDIYPNNPSSLTRRDIDHLTAEFGSYIDFVGFTNDVYEWYKKSHILLLPSEREGFPVCVMEASSVGLPCLGYNVVGVNDAIKNGVNGFLVEPSNITELAKAAELLLDLEKLEFFRISSSKYAADNFNIIPKTRNLVNILVEK
ncbi:glycosyltransferase [Motilimonas sp. E26]|uniref:glycosyltransferase n=1 Tax=Motilimonas sp. E26 TaxID=2865674 RepID=UPI001E3A847B|nr:glycosyltransferase [Motilimonas sp. E26]MCE0558580.1 glycosyltransferase [Motilimonas sp. E26]